MADAGAPLVECYPVADTYADGLGRIEKTGENLRFIMFVNRAHDDGTLDHEITARVVMPIEAVVPAVMMLLSMPCLGMQLLAAFTEYLSHQRAGMLN